MACSLTGHWEINLVSAFSHALLKDPSFYVRWLFIGAGIVGVTAMLISLAGILLFPRNSARYMLVGGWIGYIIFGVAFPYHFITHDYYHLPLIPIIAIGINPGGRPFGSTGLPTEKLAASHHVCRVVLLGVGMNMWDERNSLVSTNYRPEIAYWQDLGNLIGHDKNIIELSGDYGYRLAYFGWVGGSLWPTNADDALRALAGQSPPDFASTFADRTSGRGPVCDYLPPRVAEPT